MAASDSPWHRPAAPATQPLVLPSGHVVQAWSPRVGEPHRLAWYAPAAALGRELAERADAELPVDDLHFLGRVDRRDGPALWAYADSVRRRTLLVDVDGTPYVAVDDRRRKVGYRFEPVDPATLAANGPLEPRSGGVVLPFRRPDRLA